MKGVLPNSEPLLPSLAFTRVQIDSSARSRGEPGTSSSDPRACIFNTPAVSESRGSDRNSESGFEHPCGFPPAWPGVLGSGSENPATRSSPGRKPPRVGGGPTEKETINGSWGATGGVPPKEAKYGQRKPSREGGSSSFRRRN